jgi:transposase InsO family protein
VGQHAALRSKLMAACHSSGLGGHSCVLVTYRHMKQLFAWKGMKNAVQEYVQSCLTCQMAKPDRAKSPSLLQPLPVPSGAWHIISLDFVEGLPLSGHADCVMVVVDKFTKYAHFIALKHPYTTASVARLFLDQIYRLHGMPTALVSDLSDRDKIFTSRQWQELFRLAQVQLKMSTAYHPQTDGQTGQVNQFLRPSFSALLVLVLLSGNPGLCWLNFGIIPASILLLAVHPLKLYTATPRGTLAFSWMISVQFPA